MGATGTSGASLALQGYATILQGQGVAKADEYQADKLDTAAKYGELKAVQTGGQMTRQLNQTLGNIDAVRAAANTDPTSPTGAAIRDNAEAIGTDQRTITVNSILQQSRQDTADAAYYRGAAKDALFSSEISAGAGILKGIAGFSFGSGGAPAGDSIGNPTVIGSFY
jgi:hypothetical protein